MSQLNGRSVVVALDKERHLRYTWNALCRLQESAGATLDELFQRPKLGFVELRLIVWAGCVIEEPALTVEGAGEAIQAYLEKGGNLGALFDKTVEALTLSGLYSKPTGETSSPLASPSS